MEILNGIHDVANFAMIEFRIVIHLEPILRAKNLMKVPGRALIETNLTEHKNIKSI